ncbi:MAG: LamG domain-containing protein [Polyangiaceae bacterium]
MTAGKALLACATIVCAGCASIAGLGDYGEVREDEDSSSAAAGGAGTGSGVGGTTGVGAGGEGGSCEPVGTTPYSVAVLASGPLAYLRFEESAGPNAADEMCQHHGIAYSEHMFGVDGVETGTKAIAFSGGYVDIVSTPELQFSGNAPYTIELWVRFTALDGSDMLVGKSQDLAGWSLARQVKALNETEWRSWRCGPVACNHLTASATGLELDQWLHIATTYDGMETALYIDGQLVEAEPSTHAVEATGNPVRIGNAAMNDRTLDGHVDEVAIYDRALSATEIGDHVNQVSFASR